MEEDVKERYRANEADRVNYSTLDNEILAEETKNQENDSRYRTVEEKDKTLYANATIDAIDDAIDRKIQEERYRANQEYKERAVAYSMIDDDQLMYSEPKEGYQLKDTNVSYFGVDDEEIDRKKKDESPYTYAQVDERYQAGGYYIDDDSIENENENENDSGIKTEKRKMRGKHAYGRLRDSKPKSLYGEPSDDDSTSSIQSEEETEREIEKEREREKEKRHEENEKRKAKEEVVESSMLWNPSHLNFYGNRYYWSTAFGDLIEKLQSPSITLERR